MVIVLYNILLKKNGRICPEVKVDANYILALAVAIFMGWFALGVIYNLRRGDTVLKWLQNGLPLIGQRTTFRWLGTSVAEMTIANAKKPFRRAEILLVLRPRDVFWMTLAAILQGRNDIIILRTRTSETPLLDLELADPKTWSGRNAIKEVTDRGCESKPYGSQTLLAPKGLLDLASTTLDALALPMQNLTTRTMRFSLRKTDNKMEIHLPFPNTRASDATVFFENLRALAKAASERS